MRSRSAGDARPAVDDAEVDAVVDRAGDDPDAVLRRPWRTRWRRCSRPPARAGRGRRATRGSVSGDLDVDGIGSRRRGWQRGRDDLVEPDAAVRRSASAPACSRLMSSRLPTSALSRSVSSSIVARNSSPFVRCPVDVVLEQARHRRLDAGERRAQVVGDGREDRRAQLVGALELVRLRASASSSSSVERAGELGDERLEDALLLGGDRPRRRGRARGRRRRSIVGAPRARPRSARRRASAPSVASSRCQSVTPSSPNVRRIASSSVGDRSRPGEPRERLGLRARSLSLGRASGRERDEAAHGTGDGQEHDQREEVLALADRERVERRREVPVDEQEARRPPRRAPARGRRPPRRPRPQQVEQQDARQPSVVAQRGERDASAAGSGDDGEHEAGDDPARRQRAGTAPCGATRPASARRVADDVDVDALARRADHAVDHRAAASALASASAASRRARSASRSARAPRRDERLRRRRRRRPRGTSPPSRSTSARCCVERARPTRPRGRPAGARARRPDRPSRAAPCARRGGRGGRRPATPVSATTTRSRVSQGRSMPCSRGTPRAPRRPGRRPRAARARAAPRGCRRGSSCRARRRSAPPGRCCRAPCAAASPPGSCRRARSGRRAARPRRGSSRAA